MTQLLTKGLALAGFKEIMLLALHLPFAEAAKAFETTLWSILVVGSRQVEPELCCAIASVCGYADFLQRNKIMSKMIALLAPI